MSPTEPAFRTVLRGLALLALLLPAAATAAPVDLRRPAAELGREAARLRVELAQAQPADRSRFASFETRLLRLEEELRTLTGRIEELEHRQRQIEQRLEALQGPARGPAAETAPVPPGAGAVPPASTAGVPATPSATADLPAAAPAATAPATTAGAPPPGPAATSPPTPPVEPDEAARRGYVLGTIPADVLRGGQGGERPAAGGGAPSTGAGGPDPRLEAALRGTADQRYQAALDLLEAGGFALAEQALSRFLDDFPNDPRAPTAAFWLAETYFFRQDFATAATVYARNYRKYGPDAPRAAETLLKLGMSLAALGDRERACQTFAELERRHPDAPAPVRQMLARERTAVGCS